MTVRLLVDFKDPADGKQYVVGNLYTSAANEAGLIATKQATSDLTGGTAWVEPVVPESIDETKGVSVVLNASGNTVLVGPDGAEVALGGLGANTVTVGAGGQFSSIQAAIDSITDNLPVSYNTGTVSVTNGSAQITFSSAPAADKVVAGRDLFSVDGVRFYQILNGPTVTGGTIFNLRETYQGSTNGTATFSVYKPNPRTVMLLPGVYDYTAVALARNIMLKPYVGITGVDRDSCIIRRNKNNPTPATTPMIGLTHGSWLRNVSIDSVDGHFQPYRMGLTATATTQTQAMMGSSWLIDNIALFNKDPNGIDTGADYWIEATFFNNDTILMRNCYFEHCWDGFSLNSKGGRLKVVFVNPTIYKVPFPKGLAYSGATFIRAGAQQTSTTDIEMYNPIYDQKTYAAGELINDGAGNFAAHLGGTYGMLVVGGGATGKVVNPSIDMAVGANHGRCSGIGVAQQAGASTLLCVGGYINITGTPADASDIVCGAYNQVDGGTLTIAGTRIDAESVGVSNNHANAITNLQGGARIKGATNSLVNTAGTMNKSANISTVGATSGTITTAET